MEPLAKNKPRVWISWRSLLLVVKIYCGLAIKQKMIMLSSFFEFKNIKYPCEMEELIQKLSQLEFVHNLNEQ